MDFSWSRMSRWVVNLLSIDCANPRSEILFGVAIFAADKYKVQTSRASRYFISVRYFFHSAVDNRAELQTLTIAAAASRRGGGRSR